jgi:hypothetical protein
MRIPVLSRTRDDTKLLSRRYCNELGHAAEIVPKDQTQGEQTIHEIWHENREVTLPCVFIDQQSVVDEFPAESIRNNDNDSFRTSSRRGIRDIGGQAVESYHVSSRLCVLSFRASKAIGTSHSADGS